MKFQHSVRDAKKYAEFDKSVKTATLKCLDILEANRYRVGIDPPKDFFGEHDEFGNGFCLNFQEFKDKLEVYTKNIKRSWGGSYNGVPTVSIGRTDKYSDKEAFNAMLLGLKNHQKPNWEEAIQMARVNEWMYVEYSSFYAHPEIGSFVSDNAKDHIEALVAHELAHAIDHFNKTCSNHQQPWKQIYAFLRRELGLVTNNMDWNLKE